MLYMFRFASQVFVVAGLIPCYPPLDPPPTEDPPRRAELGGALAPMEEVVLE